MAQVASASNALSESIHGELEVGFLAGDRSLGAIPFASTGRDAPVGGLDGPFRAYPLSDTFVTGPRAEVRVVAPPLRVSVGWQRPYPDWETAVPERTERDGDGASVTSSVRALRTDEVLLGLGVEAPTGVLVPFVDLVGTIHHSSVTLEVDGRPADYTSDGFSLGVRGGLRLQCAEHVFVQGAGQFVPTGPQTWGATLGLGVAL